MSSKTYGPETLGIRQIIGLRLFIALGISLFTLVESVYAAKAVNLFEQSIAVESQTASDRAEAAKRGLERVLVRVSGEMPVPEVPSILSALRDPEPYISGYRYKAASDEANKGLSVIFDFDKSAVERLLRESGVPVWPANRPESVIWLVKDDIAVGRTLVSLQETLEGGWLEVAAQHRGLPLVLPLMDLEDRLSMSPHDLWSLDSERVLASSRRYQADVLVVGRYGRVSSGRWLSSWAFLHRDRQEFFDSEADTDIEVLHAGINALADFLAEQYSIVGSIPGYQSDESAYWVRVEQVNGFSDYLAVNEYLEALPVVDTVNLSVSGPGFLLFKVQTENELSLVLDALSLDRKLMIHEALGRSSGKASGSQSSPLVFSWNP